MFESNIVWLAGICLSFSSPALAKCLCYKLYYVPYDVVVFVVIAVFLLSNICIAIDVSKVYFIFIVFVNLLLFDLFLFVLLWCLNLKISIQNISLYQKEIFLNHNLVFLVFYLHVFDLIPYSSQKLKFCRY